MLIDVLIDYEENGRSSGIVVDISNSNRRLCNFSVWAIDFEVFVEFDTRAKKSDLLFVLRSQARAMIVREYAKLRVLLSGNSFAHMELWNMTGYCVGENTALRNLLAICVDGRKNADVYGRLYATYNDTPTRFINISSLLIEMEQIYDVISFPQATCQMRSFQNKKKTPSGADEKGLSDVSELSTFRLTGEKATFVVKVEFRRNATWQGTVTWVEGEEKQSFRSALELIRLIDSASGEEEKIKDSTESL